MKRIIGYVVLQKAPGFKNHALVYLGKISDSVAI